MSQRAVALILAVFALSALAGCGPAAPLGEPPTPAASWRPPSPYPPVEPPTPGPSPELPPAIRQRVEPAQAESQAAKALVQGQMQRDLLQIELDAARIRGLDPKEDVPEYFISRDELRKGIAAQQAQTYTREAARYDSLELWLLRMIPQPSLNLRQVGLDLLSDQLVGYYDPAGKELFVLNGSEGLEPRARETLAHEFVHSLQDQHFGLGGLLGDSSSGERSIAGRALVEGDASLSGLLYADEFLSADDFRQLRESGTAYSVTLERVPRVFRESLLFPYTRGLEFTQALYARGGFSTINAALNDPPVSTEQILHPEKYLASPRDMPIAVGVPPLTGTLGAGWVYRETDTMGEFDLALMLSENGVTSYAQAAEGWGGGQYDLYEKGSQSLLILGTIWDSGQDASEFEAALRLSLARSKQFGKLWTDGKRYFALKRVNDRVFFFSGTDRTSVDLAPGAVK